MSEPRFLNLSIRVHGGRFHGMAGRSDEWPPAPARVFQALVAAASRGRTIPDTARTALAWLESLSPPTVGAPHATLGQPLEVFVPHNDMDSVGGVAERVSEIRAPKHVSPKLFDEDQPLLYTWRFEGDAPEALTVCAIAHELYQLGRGVDQAWAEPSIELPAAYAERLANYRGRILAATAGTGGVELSCPTVGTLRSLEDRFAGTLTRITRSGTAQQFVQPPKPRLTLVAYGSPAARFTFDLVHTDQTAAIVQLDRVAGLVALVRALAAERLTRAVPEGTAAATRYLVADPAKDLAGADMHVRVLALPSIGHEHADRGIRRIVVEVPSHCPLQPEDVRWAFSGLELYDQRTGVLHDVTLTPADDASMLSHFGFDRTARRWRSVTPLALPEHSGRRRIEPSRQREEAKPGRERSTEEARACAAALAAINEVGVHARVETIRVQREPFERKGVRAEPFASGTPFRKEWLWHLEVAFSEPVAGPLVIGDGRFSGLGLMAPAGDAHGVLALAIEGGLADQVDPEELARAFRRAMLARMQAVIGRRALSPFLSGHNASGESTRIEHLGFSYDPTGHRLIVVVPRVWGTDRDHVITIEKALANFDDLRAGRAGRLKLSSTTLDPERDPLLAASRVWTSSTPYEVNRHGRGGAHQTIIDDVIRDCQRARLPRPRVEVLEARGLSGRGLRGFVRLTFEAPVRGPLVFGRTRHLGGGLFAGNVD